MATPHSALRRPGAPPRSILAASLSLLCAACVWVGDDDRAQRLDPDADGALWPDDCDDADPSVGAPSTWYLDEDADGHGGSTETTACEPPAGFVATSDDCDDSSSDVSPSAGELCDGVDNDCDGDVDDGLPLSDWFEDSDRDGAGSPDSSTEACAPPDGFVGNDDDCDDGDPAVNPSRSESWYDGVDNDCDATTVDGDQDGDGFTAVVAGGDDCDDCDEAIHPDAEEGWYDGVDQDCSGGSDYDQDGDGFDTEDSGGEDCDDLNAAVYPGAPEVIDGLSNSCGEFADQVTLPQASQTILGSSEGEGWGATAAIWPGAGTTGALLVSVVSGEGASSEGEVFLHEYDPAGGVFDAKTNASASLTGHDAGKVATIGDLDGDGLAELAIADINYASQNHGRVWIMNAPMTGAQELDTVAWRTVTGQDAGRLGVGLDALGDVDGDGLADLLLGAYGVDGFAGEAYVFTGLTSAAASLDPDDAATTVRGVLGLNHNLGSGVYGVDDLNGDGLADFLVGAKNADEGETAAGGLYLYCSPAGTDRTDDDADGVYGVSTYLARVGNVAAIGDFNGDGDPDLALSDQDVGDDEGAIYLHYGLSAGCSQTSPVDLATQADATIVGEAGERVGSGLEAFSRPAQTEDMLLLAASGAATATSSVGVVLGITGVPTGTTLLSDLSPDVEISAGDTASVLHGVVAVGDANGDGTDDLLVGSSADDRNGAGAGATALFLAY